MNTVFNNLTTLIENNSSFKLSHKYTSEEIESFENKVGWELPKEYVEFLKEVGSFEHEHSSYGLIFKFINIENIESWSNDVFPTSENLFPEILLIATSTGGENFGFIKGKKHLYVFNPECPCYLWLEEQMEEYEFKEWLNILHKSKMEELW